MVSALDSGASGPSSSPGRGHCVVFFGKTLYSLSTQVYKWVPANLMLGVTLRSWTSIPSRGEQTSPQTATPTNFFAAFRVTFVMPRVCFKSITWYIEMHQVRTFFLCGVLTFSNVMFFHNMFIFKRKAYRAFCAKKKHSESVLIIM